MISQYEHTNSWIWNVFTLHFFCIQKTSLKCQLLQLPLVFPQMTSQKKHWSNNTGQKIKHQLPFLFWSAYSQRFFSISLYVEILRVNKCALTLISRGTGPQFRERGRPDPCREGSSLVMPGGHVRLRLLCSLYHTRTHAHTRRHTRVHTHVHSHWGTGSGFKHQLFAGEGTRGGGSCNSGWSPCPCMHWWNGGLAEGVLHVRFSSWAASWAMLLPDISNAGARIQSQKASSTLPSAYSCRSWEPRGKRTRFDKRVFSCFVKHRSQTVFLRFLSMMKVIGTHRTIWNYKMSLLGIFPMFPFPCCSLWLTLDVSREYPVCTYSFAFIFFSLFILLYCWNCFAIWGLRKIWFHGGILKTA